MQIGVASRIIEVSQFRKKIASRIENSRTRPARRTDGVSTIIAATAACPRVRKKIKLQRKPSRRRVNSGVGGEIDCRR